jgi:membrane-associated phospholipid phosphatase
MNLLRHLDERLLTDVNGLARRTPWLHGTALGYAAYGVALFEALLVTGVVLHRSGTDRRLAAAGWACVATPIAVGLNQPLVAALSEARPYTTHPSLLVLASPSSDFSFPSDHATMAGAAAAALWPASRRLGAIATGGALAMVFSRVYIAAHYPWDVAAGLVVGALVALIGWALVKIRLTALTGRLRRLPALRRMFPAPAASPARQPEPAAASGASAA